MSTKTSLPPQVVINAASMAANITSSPTILNSMTVAGYYVTWTGSTPVGTLSVEASGDYKLNPDGTVANAGTWNALVLSVGVPPTASTTIAVSGNTGKEFIDLTKTGAWAVRLIYTFGSGTGSLTALMNAKVS